MITMPVICNNVLPMIYYSTRRNPEQRIEHMDWLCANIRPIRDIENSVRQEAVRYFTRCERKEGLPLDLDERDELDIVSWWRDPQLAGDLPMLKRALGIALLYHPTSAAAERVFSLINNYMGKHQMSSTDVLMKATVGVTLYFVFRVRFRDLCCHIE